MCLPTGVSRSHVSQKTAAPFCCQGSHCCLLLFPDNLGISHCIGNTDPRVSRKEGESSTRSRQLSEARGTGSSENPGPLWQPGGNFSYNCHCWHLAPSHSSGGLLGYTNKKKGEAKKPHFRIFRELVYVPTFWCSYQPWKMNGSSENSVSQKESQKWNSSLGL